MKNSAKFAERLAKVIDKKLGENILILDLRDASPLADFFVLATANSTLHAQAIARALVEKSDTRGFTRPHHIEGMDTGQWILLDYIDVIVHIFLGEVREFYGLERLWGDVPQQRVGGEMR
ncbi:MAG: ribosome silencing factor [candidate division WOR-3 bacterium]|jgi:ribosome-associated protein